MPSTGRTRPPRHERAERGQRVRRRRLGPAGPARTSSTLSGRVWIVAWPSRTSSRRRGPTPRKRIAAQPLAALDRLEQVGRRPPSSRRRNAPIGVSRSAARVARRRIVSALPARRFASVRLSGSVVVMCRWPPAVGGSGAPPENQNDLSSPGRKVVPSAVPPSFGDAALVTDGSAGRSADRRCPVSLALCAGAY